MVKSTTENLSENDEGKFCEGRRYAPQNPLKIQTENPN